MLQEMMTKQKHFLKINVWDTAWGLKLWNHSESFGAGATEGITTIVPEVWVKNKRFICTGFKKY